MSKQIWRKWDFPRLGRKSPPVAKNRPNSDFGVPIEKRTTVFMRCLDDRWMNRYIEWMINRQKDNYFGHRHIPRCCPSPSLSLPPQKRTKLLILGFFGWAMWRLFFSQQESSSNIMSWDIWGKQEEHHTHGALLAMDYELAFSTTVTKTQRFRQSFFTVDQGVFSRDPCRKIHQGFPPAAIV